MLSRRILAYAATYLCYNNFRHPPNAEAVTLNQDIC